MVGIGFLAMAGLNTCSSQNIAEHADGYTHETEHTVGRHNESPARPMAGTRALSLMSGKFDRFMEALEALCREHGCQIAPSGYDTIDIWDLQEGEAPLHGGVIDETRQYPRCDQ
jgi:hypothetical protein